MRWLIVFTFLATSVASAQTLFQNLRSVFEEKAASDGLFLASFDAYASDFNYDEIEDVLVLFTVESLAGNAYSQHASLLLGNAELGYEGTDVELGDKTTRMVSYKGFKDGVFYFDTQYVKEEDPFCCPTGVGTLFMTHTPNRLVVHEAEGEAVASLFRYAESKMQREKETLSNRKTQLSKAMCQISNVIPFNLTFSQIWFQKEIESSIPIEPSMSNLRAYYSLSSYPVKMKFINESVEAVERTPNMIGIRGCGVEILNSITDLY